MVGLLAIAPVPAGVVGGLFHHQVEEAATPLVFIGAAFIGTGFMNWSTRGRGGGGTKPDPGVAGAAGIGAAQAVAAVVRGISRSGSTVCAGLWSGLDPVAAAEFSFLLAIPVIGGGAGFGGGHAAGGVAPPGAPALAG